MKVGKDNVLVGDFPEGTVIGDGNVFWRATDASGNVRLDKPMAMGNRARSYGNSIAVGAYAGSGLSPIPLEELLPELTALIQKAVAVGTADANKAVIEAIALRDAIQRPDPDMGALATSWKAVEMFATACGVVDGLDKLKQAFSGLLP